MLIVARDNPSGHSMIQQLDSTGNLVSGIFLSNLSAKRRDFARLENRIVLVSESVRSHYDRVVVRQ
jgi:hypothetical protein